MTVNKHGTFTTMVVKSALVMRGTISYTVTVGRRYIALNLLLVYCTQKHVLFLYHKLSLLNFREFIFHCSLDPRKYFNDEIFQNYGTSDVTVDYSVPLPCALVSFPRVRTLATLGAVGDDKFLDLQLQIKLVIQKHIHSPPVYSRQPETQKGVKHR